MTKKLQPKLRFRGFTDAWEQRKFSSIFGFLKTNSYSRASLQPCSTGIVDIHYGDILVNYDCCFSIDTHTLPTLKDPSLADVYRNDLLMDGDIVIADTAEDQTAGKCVELFDVGNRKVLAGLHTIAVRGRIKFGTGYLGYYLSSPAYRKQLLPQMQGTKVISISKTALTNTVIASPCLAEQTAIGALLRKLDVLIAAEKRKLNLLRTKKSGLMQEIFSQKVRFKGYQKEWKRYRMKDISYIERGASPRPISKYTTTDKSGLNWVKIGDAPSLGNVITSTSERIKPKGLPKTRSVHPGDLILSNSMSFGRPYIMGIDGCIHDGWLLIRTNRSKVNPSFLCQALGSQFMISQYRRLAAGSAVNNLNKSIVGNAVIMIPSLKEQNAIEKLLSCYDKLIAAENQKVNILVDQKKALLERMLA